MARERHWGFGRRCGSLSESEPRPPVGTSHTSSRTWRHSATLMLLGVHPEFAVIRLNEPESKLVR